jgi:hypothetical protein
MSRNHVKISHRTETRFHSQGSPLTNYADIYFVFFLPTITPQDIAY